MARRKPKLGSIFQRGSVYWIKYYKGGRAYRESSKSQRYEDAERLLKRRHGEIALGKFVGLAVERITMGELLGNVETDYEENERGSLAQLKSRLRNHLIPAFGHLRAAEFGTDD